MNMNFNTLGKTATLALRVSDSRKPTEPLLTGSKPKQLSTREPIAAPLPTSTPEAEGIPSRTLSAFFEALRNDASLHMHTVLVLCHGKVISRASFLDYDYSVAKSTFSACKSVTALAVGMLRDDGKLSVDDPVLPIFEGDFSLSPLARLRYRDLKIRDLLTMRAAATFAEADAMAEENWLHGFFSSNASGTVGETFQYNSLCTYVLSAIVQKISGETLFAFLKRRLFDPLSIRDVFWEESPEGITKGGWGLYIRPDDLAKIGQMVLNGGTYEGIRCVSEAWIDEMTSPSVAEPLPGGRFAYGYQVWIERESGAFLFNGMLGQNVLGIRQNGLLFVSNAGNDETFQTSSYFDAVLPFCRLCNSGSLPPDRKGQAALAAAEHDPKSAPPPKRRCFLSRLFSGKASAAFLPSACARYAGRRYLPISADSASCGLLPIFLQVLQNNYSAGLESVSFRTEDGTFFLRYREKDEEHRIPVGFDEPKLTAVSFHGESYWVRCFGRFTEDEDGTPVLVLRIAFPETACTRTLKFFFGSAPRMIQTEQPGGTFVSAFLSDFLKEYAEKPVIGAAVSHVSEDYLDYRVGCVFSPCLKMREDASAGDLTE